LTANSLGTNLVANLNGMTNTNDTEPGYGYGIKLEGSSTLEGAEACTNLLAPQGDDIYADIGNVIINGEVKTTSGSIGGVYNGNPTITTCY
jgi:hypothetical protein